MDETALNKQLVRDMLSALVKNRVGMMADFWWEDMIWVGPPGIGTMRGLQQFEYDLRASFLHSFPDKEMGESIFLGEGEWVVAQGFSTRLLRGIGWASPRRGARRASAIRISGAPRCVAASANSRRTA